FLCMHPATPRSTLFPYTTLFRSKIGNAYGKGLGNSQKTNFAPRFGFAYQVTDKLVARGGFGIFYNGFENRGFSPNRISRSHHVRSEEHTSELQSHLNLVCRLLLE